jgi:hypothetical protein
MTLLDQFLLDLIKLRPGMFGAEIRARFGGKIPAKKINLALRGLKMNGHIRISESAGEKARFYVKVNPNVN